MTPTSGQQSRLDYMKSSKLIRVVDVQFSAAKSMLVYAIIDQRIAKDNMRYAKYIVGVRGGVIRTYYSSSLEEASFQ